MDADSMIDISSNFEAIRMTLLIYWKNIKFVKFKNNNLSMVRRNAVS